MTHQRRSPWLAAVAGAAVGLLGGLVGLGGAEFRLPLLLGLFAFAALPGVIVNKALSLTVVVAAIPSRLGAVPFDQLAAHGIVAASLLAGSLPGAWTGAAWATRMRTATLYRVLALLLVAIAAVFAAHHLGRLPHPHLPAAAQAGAGVVAGFGIGVVAALMGVAGGELLVPVITVLFAVDVKVAGSLSLLVSLPTMLVGFARYSRSQAFAVLRDDGRFVAAMAAGSVAGAVAGGLLLGVVPTAVLVPAVVVLLLASAVEVWRHARPPGARVPRTEPAP
ncbi:sulfite exporter TauE/SafE family protein [Geodermatophilus sp. SYSU D00700]